MRANELRIGNIVEYLVHDELANPKLEWVENVVDLDDLRAIETSENYRPMKLNEDILLKFGFEVRYTIGHSAQYYINENPVTHDWMLSILWLEGGSCPFYKNGHHKIKHVHQLQNLYFALTGEELTYTQP